MKTKDYLNTSRLICNEGDDYEKIKELNEFLKLARILDEHPSEQECISMLREEKLKKLGI